MKEVSEDRFICRGISKETGEFVYGYYVSDKGNEHYLITSKSEFLEGKEGDYITNIIEITH
jgi:hypothetical protein